jgi:hypothetical protein
MEVKPTAGAEGAAAAPAGEAARKLQPIKGHAFSKVLGEQEARYVNRSGNARDGQEFTRVWRDGRCFHVYGEGAERTVVRLPARESGAEGAAKAPEDR